MLEIARPSVEPYVEIRGRYHIPENAIHPEYVIPDEVLCHVALCLGMDEPYNIGADPMCGNGSVVSFINEIGGFCYGIELSGRHSEIARTALSQIEPSSPPGWLFGQAPEIVHGDCTEVTLPHDLRYLWASPGFREILDGTIGDDIVQAFDRMLLPPGAASFIVVDSADEAFRDGVVVNPAAATVPYFERSGLFLLLDKVSFRVTNAPPGCDDQFTELMFVRREEWDYWREFNPKPLSRC